MNVQEYISSGILESYVLGFCTEDEKLQVELLMNEHVAIREEVRTIQDTLELAAMQSPVPPAFGLKSKIWDAIQEDSVPIITMQPEIETPVSSNGRSWLAYAASFALIFGAASTAVFFYSQNRRMENSLALIEKTNLDLKDQVQKSKDSIANLGLKMGLIAHSETKKVTLAGVPTSKDSKAVVFWNKVEKVVILTAVNLPQAPSDKQYQLWALVDGVPVDAGVLDQGMNSSHMVEMKSIDKSQAFAITLEPKGGSASPHLDALCVIGNV